MNKSINYPPVIWALVLDTLLVLVFAIIGRLTHHEELDFSSIAVTAIPFLLGSQIAWLLGRMWRKNPYRLLLGLHVAVVTEICGQIGHVLIKGQTQISFIIASTIALLVFLVGWRGIYRLTQKIRKK